MKQKEYKIFKKRKTLHFVMLVAFVCLFQSCEQKKQPVAFTNTAISGVITKMTNIMVHDVTNPPLAARFFSYACLAGYEVVSENDSSIRTMRGVLNDYPTIRQPQIKNNNYQLSALLAMMETAKKMQP